MLWILSWARCLQISPLFQLPHSSFPPPPEQTIDRQPRVPPLVRVAALCLSWFPATLIYSGCLCPLSGPQFCFVPPRHAQPATTCPATKVIPCKRGTCEKERPERRPSSLCGEEVSYSVTHVHTRKAACTHTARDMMRLMRQNRQKIPPQIPMI